MYGSPHLDHFLGSLLNRGVGFDTRIEDSSYLIESGAEVNRCGSSAEEMIEEGFDVIAKFERRRQEIRS